VRAGRAGSARCDGRDPDATSTTVGTRVRRVSARLTCLPLRLPWPAGGSRGRPESARLPHIARAPRRPGACRGAGVTLHFSRISPCTHTVFSCIFIILIVILPSRVRLRVVHSLVLVSRFVSVHTSLLFYTLTVTQSLTCAVWVTMTLLLRIDARSPTRQCAHWHSSHFLTRDTSQRRGSDRTHQRSARASGCALDQPENDARIDGWWTNASVMSRTTSPADQLPTARSDARREARRASNVSSSRTLSAPSQLASACPG
jgi:hypothetical protein